MLDKCPLADPPVGLAKVHAALIGHPPKALRPVRKRKLVDEVRGEWGVSIRRACRVLLVDTSTYHYKSRRAGHAGLEQPIKYVRPACATAIDAFTSCCGARGLKKTRQVYRELGLQLRNKTPKRRVSEAARGPS
jgi:putative transposase